MSIITIIRYNSRLELRCFTIFCIIDIYLSLLTTFSNSFNKGGIETKNSLIFPTVAYFTPMLDNSNAIALDSHDLPALNDGLYEVFRNIGIVCQKLFGIFWQTITTIAEAWVIVMSTNAWIKTYTFYDSFGIKTFDLSVCVKLIEIAYAKGKIGIGEEFHSLRLLHAHEKSVNISSFGFRFQAV